MNCRNFEVTVSEIARGQILDARNKADTLSHLEMCKTCTARLADQRALSAGLRAVAKSDAQIEAAGRIESELASAFRQRTTAEFTSTAIAPADKSGKWVPWSIAAAATILVVSAFALLEFVTAKRGDPLQSSSTAPSRSSSESEEPTLAPDNLGYLTGVAEPIPDNSQAGPRSEDRRRSVFRDVGLRGRLAPNRSRAENRASAHEEVATEFLPLTYGSNLSQLDDVQVVRVELPRSVLQSFGLPMNVERTGQRVKADVLLGHDGVARAIRFVK